MLERLGPLNGINVDVVGFHLETRLPESQPNSDPPHKWSEVHFPSDTAKPEKIPRGRDQDQTGAIKELKRYFWKKEFSKRFQRVFRSQCLESPRLT